MTVYGLNSNSNSNVGLVYLSKDIAKQLTYNRGPTRFGIMFCVVEVIDIFERDSLLYNIKRK